MVWLISSDVYTLTCSGFDVHRSGVAARVAAYQLRVRLMTTDGALYEVTSTRTRLHRSATKSISRLRVNLQDTLRVAGASPVTNTQINHYDASTKLTNLNVSTFGAEEKTICLSKETGRQNSSRSVPH